MEQPSWVPTGVDVTVPNAARMYDYALGGSHNFTVDRQTADRVEELVPGAKLNAHANRAFVDRVVRWLTERGIRQFLDIGSGIPTMGNVHEVARSTVPNSRIVYVDIDPVAIAHSKAILAGVDHVRVVHADLAHPADVLYHPDVLDLLDFSQPTAVLLNAVLHFIADTARPQAILEQIHEAVARGSYLTITHGTPMPEAGSGDKQEGLLDLYRRTPTALHLRPPAQIRELLGNWEILEPGIVPIHDWQPNPDDPQPPAIGMVAAVAHKP